MKNSRTRTIRRVVAAGGAIALISTMAACGSDKKDASVSEPAPSAAATADPSAAPSSDATAAPTSVPAGPAAGNAVGAVTVRSVPLTSSAWGDPATKAPVVALIKAGKIDNVQIDIKDEDGLVGYDSKVPLAVQAGTVYLQGGKPRFDIDATVK